MFVTLRYTQFEEMRNFPRMTVAQWYLLSLKDYINPLCVSWLWIQWCGTKRSSKTWFFSDRSLVMLMRQSQGSVLWWSNIAAAWLNIILHTQRCGKFMSDCFFWISFVMSCRSNPPCPGMHTVHLGLLQFANASSIHLLNDYGVFRFSIAKIYHRIHVCYIPSIYPQCYSIHGSHGI